jgi:hypothetical protein
MDLDVENKQEGLVVVSVDQQMVVDIDSDRIQLGIAAVRVVVEVVEMEEVLLKRNLMM